MSRDLIWPRRVRPTVWKQTAVKYYTYQKNSKLGAFASKAVPLFHISKHTVFAHTTYTLLSLSQTLRKHAYSSI